MEGSPKTLCIEDFQKRNGGGRLRGGACAAPSTPRFILGRAKLRSNPVSLEGGIARESSAEMAAMHRFRIARMAERPSAQVQDSGAPEGYRRQEPLRKREGPQNNVMFRRRGGGKTLSRKEKKCGGALPPTRHLPPPVTTGG